MPRIAAVVLTAAIVLAPGLQAQSKRELLDKELASRIADRSAITFAPVTTAHTVANEADSTALVLFYRALGGSVFWSNDTGWLQAPLSDWHGITLDTTGRVTHINLPSNTLLGELPSQIGDLAHLQVLDLSNNVIGGVIPSSIGALDSLRTISLWGNILQGSLPVSLANLQLLEDLLLFLNRLEGEIPLELGQLSRLRRLWLDFNQLTGMIPPELSQLSSLTELFVDSNQLQGTIPVTLSTMPNLIALYVGYNQLEGRIPPELGNISTLENFSAAGNRHTGNIPPELSRPPLLTKIFLSHNLLEGSIPQELASLRVLTTLEAGSNKLSGPLPEHLGRIPQLRVLDLSDNAFEGAIPGNLGFANGLTHLDLSDNRLTGNLPGFFSILDRMRVLDLSGNQLTGPIDVIYNMTRLTSLNLRGNQFEGGLAANFGFMPILHTVDLGGNAFSGSLEYMFSFPTTIEFLSLDGNQFDGALPASITQSKQLVAVRLQDNQFSSIPDFTTLENLDTLDVSGNRLGFVDLVQNAPIALRGEYRYAPQDSVKTHLTRTSAEIILSVAGHTPGNEYQWYRNGTMIDGAQSDSLRLDINADRARYHAVITNSLLPDLTLVSRKVDSHGDPTAVEPVQENAFQFELHQSFPNPMRGSATINYGIAEPGHVRVTLYNMLGQEVATILDRPLEPGTYSISLDGTSLTPGVYLYRLTAGQKSATQYLTKSR